MLQVQHSRLVKTHVTRGGNCDCMGVQLVSDVGTGVDYSLSNVSSVDHGRHL